MNRDKLEHQFQGELQLSDLPLRDDFIEAFTHDRDDVVTALTRQSRLLLHCVSLFLRVFRNRAFRFGLLCRWRGKATSTMMIIPESQNTPTAPRQGMKLCPQCQKEIAEGARTCPGCGKTFTTAGGVFIAIIIALILGGGFLVSR